MRIIVHGVAVIAALITLVQQSAFGEHRSFPIPSS